MIEINTFIKIGHDQFMNFSAYHYDIKDVNNIEGSIHLNINRVILLKYNMCDYIDKLWANLVEGLEQIKNNNEFKTHFESQPIEIKLKPIGNDVLVSVNSNLKVEVLINKKYFIKAMSEHALYFFNKLSGFNKIQENRYQSEIEQLERICL